MSFAAGQCWSFRAPPGFEGARIVIGAILRFQNTESIVCCSVLGAPRRAPDGRIEAVTIPFLPMSETALAQTVVASDGVAELPESFAARLDEWANDPRGLTTFTVPFDGYLDHLIAHQMASIVGLDAA
jgi:hypothetical protein